MNKDIYIYSSLKNVKKMYFTDLYFYSKIETKILNIVKFVV